MGGEMATQAPPSFSAVLVNKPLTAANRLMAVVHATLAAATIAHRLYVMLSAAGGAAAVARHVAMAAADLTLAFLWALSQSGLWRPVRRATFPDRLVAAARGRGARAVLPGVDVLVVTADPDKEPALGVMNTVVSAMALDYPGARLAVYLSDDAGSPLTLHAARKAYAFARAWVPFCRKYSLPCPCPERYFFAGDGGDLGGGGSEEMLRIKEMYKTFKRDLEEASRSGVINSGWTKETRQDHDAYVEIIAGDDDGDGQDEEEERMPLLVYVSREKRRGTPHHFKAGALNALLRVSGAVSNAPYVLVLDCDMSCNTRTSALEAMCFFFSSNDGGGGGGNSNLAFVQFPQMFHNVSANDIYTNDLRYIFQTRWFGLDGFRGPLLSGTGFYARRDALCGATPPRAAPTTTDDAAGGPDTLRRQSSSRSSTHQQQLQAAASCAADAAGTGWGHEVGFMYQSVVEDYFTGYRRFFSRGWTSAYCYHRRDQPPAFLGSVPTNLNDVLVQNKRWMSGMLAVGLSPSHCPLGCRDLLAASVPQAMAYTYFGLAALYAFPALCYATLPQLCFLRGVPLFPGGGGGGWRWPPAAAAFASSLLLHLAEASVARGGLALRTFWNEQRFWMLNAVTGQLFGCVAAFQELVGAAALDFDLTSKGASDAGLYRRGVFDFTGCSALLLPATTLCLLNAAALVGGTWRAMVTTGGSGGGSLSGELLPQLLLLSYVAALSYPLLEGMFTRQDPARVPARITALSVAIAAVLLAVFA